MSLDFKERCRYIRTASNVNWLIGEASSAKKQIEKGAAAGYGKDYRRGLELERTVADRIKEIAEIRTTNLTGRHRAREGKVERRMRDALIDLVSWVEKLDMSGCECVQRANVEAALVRAREVVVKNSKPVLMTK